MNTYVYELVSFCEVLSWDPHVTHQFCHFAYIAISGQMSKMANKKYKKYLFDHIARLSNNQNYAYYDWPMVKIVKQKHF